MSFLQEKQFHKNKRKDLETKTISLRTCLIIFHKVKSSLIGRTYSPYKTNSAKRMSQYISLNGMKGSITIETALVFPIFLFFMINIISMIPIFQVYSSMEAALHQIGRKMAVYAYAVEEVTDRESIETSAVSSAILSTVYVKEKLVEYLGEAYLENSPIKGGKRGISLIQSSIMKDEIIDLVAIYTVEPAFGMMGLKEFCVVNRCKIRAWTGYDNAGERSLSQDGDELVYITENGTVYHKEKECTHLRLSIQMTEYGQIKQMRNVYGSKYTLCELCSPVTEGMVYITNQGDKYHTSVACSGLKRTVIAISIKEAGGRSPCMRCG